MSYKEGTGLTDALGWGEDSKFMFRLLEEVGLFLQRATSQADIFLPKVLPGGLRVPLKLLMALEFWGGGRNVLFCVSQVDVALKYKPLGRVWGDRGASATWAIPAEREARTMSV